MNNLTKESIIKDINIIYKQIYGVDRELEVDKTWRENDLDSLDEVEFLMEVEKKYGLVIDNRKLLHIDKPIQLVDLCLEEMSYKKV